MDARSAEESIERTLGAFQDGWNRRDLEDCFAAFSRDADFVSAAGRWWRGRREIADRFGDQLPDGGFRTTSVAIRFLRSDVAVVHVGWEAAGAAPRRGLMTWVMCRRKGRWAVEAAQNTNQNDTVSK